MDKKIPKTDEEWKKKLSPQAFGVLRMKGTEAPFTGELLHNKGDGDYTCAACGVVLFSSGAKFDSGTGWPSFDEPANTKNIELRQDNEMGMSRTEVVCKNCGGHLGHVFNDGPTQTGQRYCINSVCLGFKPANKEEKASIAER